MALVTPYPPSEPRGAWAPMARSPHCPTAIARSSRPARQPLSTMHRHSRRSVDFDEDFFCYLEDVDLGFRLRLLGERCVQVRRAEVLHVGSAITGQFSDFSVFHSYRNRIWLFWNNLPWPLLVVLAPLQLLAIVVALLGTAETVLATAIGGCWRDSEGWDPH